MYTIHYFNFAANSFKVLAVAEELGVECDLCLLNPQKGEHKSPDHLARHPLGKVPTLTHNNKTLFESAAICKYLATMEKSKLYPSEDFERARTDQWMDFFAIHLGRWLSSLYFERVIKKQLGREPDAAAMEEAHGFATKQAQAVDDHLKDHRFLVGTTLTIADFFAYSYIRSAEQVGFSLAEYGSLQRWHDHIKALPSITRTEKKVVD